MQQFKVGDLVIVKSNSEETIMNNGRAVNFIGKIVNIAQYPNICVHPIDPNSPLADFYKVEELEHWQPRLGEWCWFYDKNSSAVPILAQFDCMDKHIYVTTEIEIPFSEEERSAYGFNSCIPFIGQLPEIPKEQQ